MNRILPSLCLLIALFSSCLLAQSSVSPKESAAPEVRHVGTSNVCPLGSKEDPVKATEYAAFLHEKGFHETFIYYSEYYDGSFMKHEYWYNNWFWYSNDPSIICTGSDYVPHPKSNIVISTYDYYAAEGHEEDIIDAVRTSTIQHEFNAWRKQHLVHMTPISSSSL